MLEQWPEDGKPVMFEDLSDPIVQALADAIGNEMVWPEPVKRRNGYAFRSGTSAIEGIEYAGYDIGNDEKATCMTPDKRLTRDSLRYAWSDQGRTPVEEIVTLAIQLGIEQGRRIERERSEAGQTLKMIRMLLGNK